MVTEHAGRTFDWAARFDPRSLNFRAAPGVTAMPTTGAVWPVGPVLDQGREGACVGMGYSGAVAAAPSSRSGVNLAYALSWYRRAQRLDEWPGEAYEGTSVLAGGKVGRARRLWTGFRWAKSPAELAAGILDPALGPAVIGVQWSEQLYEVPATGLMPGDVTLDPEMGHCVLLFGYVPERPGRDLQTQVAKLGLWPAVSGLGEPSFLLLNSWGQSWGHKGMAVAPLSLVRRWFAARGEFALPENRTKGRTTMTASDEDQQPATDVDEDQPADVTLHLTAAEVQAGDRILDPPDALGQESVTVRAVSHRRAWSGRLVQVTGRAVTFSLPAGTPVTVRRPQQ